MKRSEITPRRSASARLCDEAIEGRLHMQMGKLQPTKINRCPMGHVISVAIYCWTYLLEWLSKAEESKTILSGLGNNWLQKTDIQTSSISTCLVPG